MGAEQEGTAEGHTANKDDQAGKWWQSSILSVHTRGWGALNGGLGEYGRLLLSRTLPQTAATEPLVRRPARRQPSKGAAVDGRWRAAVPAAHPLKPQSPFLSPARTLTAGPGRCQNGASPTQNTSVSAHTAANTNGSPSSSPPSSDPHVPPLTSPPPRN